VALGRFPNAPPGGLRVGASSFTTPESRGGRRSQTRSGWLYREPRAARGLGSPRSSRALVRPMPDRTSGACRRSSTRPSSCCFLIRTSAPPSAQVSCCPRRICSGVRYRASILDIWISSNGGSVGSCSVTTAASTPRLQSQTCCSARIAQGHWGKFAPPSGASTFGKVG